jgi:hypothetical protein|tara:strand:+ start:18 stop:461 length:444 start_codon:yes stop_codon:yes gene_type:complete
MLYNLFDMYNRDLDETLEMANNKLLCTFVPVDEIDPFIEKLTSRYSIMYNKVFILNVRDSQEYACTYNLEQPDINNIPDNTISVHRKKESNTLYTINALNELIKSLNGGVVDTRFRIDWKHYRNTILLTTQGELKFLRTKIYEIKNV